MNDGGRNGENGRGEVLKKGGLSLRFGDKLSVARQVGHLLKHAKQLI